MTGVAADADFVELLTTHPPRVSGSSGAVNCEPGWSWRFSGMGDFDAWAVVAGRGEAVVDGERAALSPGTVLLLRPESSGTAEQNPNDRLSVLYCHFSFGPMASPAGGLGPRPTGTRTLPARVSQLSPENSVVAHLRALLHLTDETGRLAETHRSALLQLVLLELWRSASSHAGRRDPRIIELVAAVRREPGRRWTLAEAAAGANLSPAHFSRIFTAEVGRSFRGFCFEVRLDRARQLLLESPMSVTEVARALGYPDVYLFSRQVSARFGVPATVIQRASRGRMARPPR